MSTKKVLNLYSGIGGNRKLWEDVEVTAVEWNEDIAKIYQEFFPDDEVIITDAHQYLLDHYDCGWDFIWSSPPCQTHSVLVKPCVEQDYKRKYPELSIYQEIIWLKSFFKGPWVIENVKPYYEPLISGVACSGHYFWANFIITNKNAGTKGIPRRGGVDYDYMQAKKGFDISSYAVKDKRTILRNCVNPELGKHIFDCAFKIIQSTIMEPSTKKAEGLA